MKAFYFKQYDYAYQMFLIDDDKLRKVVVCEDDLGGYCKCLKDMGYEKLQLERDPKNEESSRKIKNGSSFWQPVSRPIKIEARPNDISQSKEDVFALY